MVRTSYIKWDDDIHFVLDHDTTNDLRQVFTVIYIIKQQD